MRAGDVPFGIRADEWAAASEDTRRAYRLTGLWTDDRDGWKGVACVLMDRMERGDRPKRVRTPRRKKQPTG